MKKVSVIIPVFNDNEALLKCLNALQNQTLSPEAFEVLVVDNGSKEPLDIDQKKYAFSLQILREEKRGSYAARNHGVKNASGEIFAFTDSDCVPQPNWLEKGVTALQSIHSNIGFVGGNVVFTYKNPKKPKLIELFDATTFMQQKELIEEKGFSVTANLFVRKDVFKKVGDFNSKLQSNGDKDWGQRATAQSFKGIYAPEVKIAHPARNFSEIKRKIRRVLQGNIDHQKSLGLRISKSKFATRHKWKHFFTKVWKNKDVPIHKKISLNGLQGFFFFFRKFERFRITSKIGKIPPLLGRKCTLLFLFSCLGGFALILAELGVSASIQLLFKSFIVSSDQPSRLPINWDFQGWQIALFFALAALIRSLSHYSVLQASRSLCERFRERLLHLLALKEFFDPKKGLSGVGASQLTHQANILFVRSGFYLEALTRMIQKGTQVVGLLAVSFYLAPFEATISLVGILLIARFVFLANRAVKSESKLSLQKDRSINKSLQQISTNWNYIQALRREPEEFQVLTQINQERTQRSVNAAKYSNFGTALPNLLGAILLGWLLLVNQTNLGTSPLDLLAFLYLLVRTVQVLSTLATDFGRFSRFSPDFHQCLQTIDPSIEHSVQITPTQKKNLKPSAVSVQVQNLEFSYSQDQKLISDFSFDVRPGDQVGIVGKSGSGKSTLLKLIMGNLTPTKGSVKIDGEESPFFFKKFPHALSYVGPNPYLIEGTIKENLLHGLHPPPSQKQLEAALERAQLFKEVQEMPKGWNTFLTESKDGLSTGQKQRLTLAKALLRNPSLLILDEVTANLDDRAEELIADSLCELQSEMTILIASHRPGILKHCSHTIDLPSPSTGLTRAQEGSPPRTLNQSPLIL